MKHQVARLSPHQNAKVLAVLMAVTSLVFFVPIAVVSGLASPSRLSAPLLTLLAGSAIYLVFGYVSVVVGCLVYNFLFRYIGGIEFESAGGD